MTLTPDASPPPGPGRLRVGSLCSGYLGVEMGLAAAGVDVDLRWIAEADPALDPVHAAHHPGVPNLRDIITADWSTVEPVDLVTAGFPCFAAGTRILVARGWVPIEDVQVGDVALTHRGRWRRVTATMSQMSDHVIRIRGQGIPDVVTTEEHPFYARERTSLSVGKTRQRVFSPPRWAAAAKIQDQFIGQVLPPIEVPELTDPNLWWLVGRYLADGWTTTGKRGNNRVVVCCAHAEADDLETRISSVVHATRSEEPTSTKFHITRSWFVRFVDLLGRGASGKTLTRRELALPEAQARALLDGWMSGDGSREATSFVATTVSRSLALSMALLAQRASGVVASIYEVAVPPSTVIAGREVGQRTQYKVRVQDRNRSAFVEGAYGWKLVRRAVRDDSPTLVYNLSVADDESYVADGAIVHNCQPVSAAGRQRGQADDRWLWPHVARALFELRPRLFLLENVRNLVSIEKGRLWAGILDDLGELGFSVRWLTLGACHVGAAHHRHRVFALATQQGHETDEVVRIPTTHCGAKVNVPTPTVGDSRNSRNETARRRGDAKPASGGTTLSDFAQLLPTPTRDGDGRGTGDAAYWAERSTRRSNGLPLDSTVALLSTSEHWGRFAAAVARHAATFGDPPPPTEPNRNGAPRLAAGFAEWLMCLPAGHVTAHLPRRDALKAIGNGVCPPQIAQAWRLLINPVIDTSLGERIPSHAMTLTTTNTEIKEIQDREADARGRVIAAACVSRDSMNGGSSTSDTEMAFVVTAAMMELAAVWREQAAWWENSGKRGGKGTAKELVQAAGRLAGFAVGLSTRPVNIPPEPKAEPLEDAGQRVAAMDVAPYCARCDTDMHRCPGCGDVVKHGEAACPECASDVDVPDRGEIPEAAIAAHLADLEAEREQVQADAAAVLAPLAGIQADFENADGVCAHRRNPTRDEDGDDFCMFCLVKLPAPSTWEALSASATIGGKAIRIVKLDADGNPIPGAEMTIQTTAQPPSAVAALVDNPFTSPGSPGSGARPAVAALPYSVLPVIASQLEPRTQLSHSFVETFESCSLKSMLRRASRHGLIGPERPGWSLVGGTAFHAAVEAVERDALAHPGRVPVSSRNILAPAKFDRVDAVVDVDGVWTAALDAAVLARVEELAGSIYADTGTWYASNGGKEGYDWWRVEGANMLARYLDFHDATWRAGRMLLRLQALAEVAPTPALELHYTTAVPATAGAGTSPLTTQGYIDAVWFSPEGPFLDIVDWKTGARKPSSTFQLGEYAHGLASLLTGHHAATATVRGSFWLARKGEYTPAVLLADKHPIDEITYRYRQAALGSGLGIATPSVSDMCVACGVKDYCPAGSSR